MIKGINEQVWVPANSNSGFRSESYCQVPKKEYLTKCKEVLDHFFSNNSVCDLKASNSTLSNVVRVEVSEVEDKLKIKYFSDLGPVEETLLRPGKFGIDTDSNYRPRFWIRTNDLSDFNLIGGKKWSDL